MSNTKQLLMVLLACCLFGASSMFAASITQTCTITQMNVPYMQSCVINDFSGTGLNSVVLSLTGVGGNVLPEQTNISTGPITFTNSVATIGLSVVGPDTISVSDMSNPCSGSVNGGSTNTTCATTSFSGLSAAAVSAASLTPYEGTGTITPTFSASGQILSASGAGGAGSAGNLFFGGTGAIGGTFTVTYNYTPAMTTTPEPATFSLIGFALLGLGVVARKRHAA